MPDLIEAKTVKAEEIEYRSWRTALRISNDTVQLVVFDRSWATDSLYGFCGGENEFHEIPEHSGKSGDTDIQSLWGPPALGVA